MSEGGLAEEPVEVFRRSVEHGVMRLERSWSGLFATGTVGGLDVGAGVLALLIVEQRTGSELLGALAFGIGFLALTLAGSELFTENFLVPVSTVVAKDAPWWSVLRLWVGTLVFNLVGGWISMGLAVVAMPELEPTARRIADDVVSKGATWSTFASAVLAGAAITLMTWMERSTDSVPVKVVAAWSIAFLLAAAPLRHAIVVSIEAFAALHAGAPFGYADWLGTLGWAALGNIVGGLGLVTLLRLIQVGPEELRRERARAHPRAEEHAPEP